MSGNFDPTFQVTVSALNFESRFMGEAWSMNLLDSHRFRLNTFICDFSIFQSGV